MSPPRRGAATFSFTSYVLAGSLVALAAACGPGEAGVSVADEAVEAGAIVRDSAGIRIVEYPGPPGPPTGRLEPLTTYGSLDGPEAFGSVAGVAVGDGAQIVVVDRQARRVTVWNPDGSLVRSFARGGAGPGELTNPNHVALLEDGRVVVGELFPAQLHWYAPDGSPLDDHRVGLSGAEQGVAAILSEWRSIGDLTRVRLAHVTLDSDEAEHVVVEVDSAGSPGDTLLRWTQPGATPRPPPVFAPSLSWDLLPDGGLAVAPGGPYEVRMHGPDGGLREILRRRTPPVPVGPDLRTRARRTFREAMEDSEAPAAMLDALAEEVEIAPRLPAVQEIRVERPRGTIWVAVPRPAEDAGELVQVASYDRYAADLSFLGRVEAPLRFRLMTVVDGVAYGVWRGPADVDYVRSYRLVVGPVGPASGGRTASSAAEAAPGP